MAFEPLQFTKNWESEADFPTYEPDERQVRADLQWLHNETRDGLNRLIAALNDPRAAAQLPFSPAEGLTAQTVQDAILEVYAAIQEAAAGLLVDGTVSREKLTQSLLERIYGGKVWVSLDTPGESHNPTADFPVGQLWLRPSFTVDNLAQATWHLTGCSAQAEDDDWILTCDGTLDTLSAEQLFEEIGLPGEKIRVHLAVAELDDHLSELALYLNNTEFDLMDGGGIFEAELDETGSLELMIWGSWPYAEANAAIRLSALTVVNTDAVDHAHSGCLPLRDWPAFLGDNVPFSQLSLPRQLFLQESPGHWAVVSHSVLPVSRGGTGVAVLGKGQMLYGSETQSMQTLDTPSENGCLLAYDAGVPVWQSKAQVMETLGQLRLMTGTYTGSAAAGTITLPVAPKLLQIHPVSGLDTANFSIDHLLCDQPAVLTDGTEAGHIKARSMEQGTFTYAAKVTLSGSTLTFSGASPNAIADYMNRSGVVYHWTALY